MYRRFLRPLLFRFDAERAHTWSLRAARLLQYTDSSVLNRLYGYHNARLEQTLWGHTWPNPLGLAAGADKNGVALRYWHGIGLGHVEVGSVSAQPCSGNERPRAFRLPDDEALINRMGLNNEGAKVVAQRLRKYAGDTYEGDSGTPPRPVGVNLAKTHDPSIMGAEGRADFCASFRELAPHATYVALNVSCPNTRSGKTFESPETLDALLTDIFALRREMALDVPILVKLSPILTERVIFDSALEARIEVAESHGVHGYIAANTAPDRHGLTTDTSRLQAIGRGGLSGPPLHARSIRLIRYLHRATEGQVPIIGVGGVDSAETAFAKIQAGASLVQLYTALVYHGPGLIKSIKQGLVGLLDTHGFDTIQEAVGTDPVLERFVL
ncbi:dihydroorotate dehydrogenase (quinone) [Longimonas halophila]|uniref:Dihydroorotate dehydrogenase (quinone) n=1 Tax=Longimonas halophila TaxID=1469170 RepID=A0A2H3P0W5_9BACT|nr:quinone-dependent dihydroorotate dehydrogenase [Longimonas halophila]PEN09210.1 dihydroorotate dehydrogenase (quinone) [Longimonas halophila]